MLGGGVGADVVVRSWANGAYPRLSPSEVQELRAFFDEGWSAFDGNGAAIARAYGISEKTFRAIGYRDYRASVPELSWEGVAC